MSLFVALTANCFQILQVAIFLAAMLVGEVVNLKVSRRGAVFAALLKRQAFTANHSPVYGTQICLVWHRFGVTNEFPAFLFVRVRESFQ